MEITEIQTIVDSGLFVLIWLVQLIIYPSFLYTEEEHFVSWHNRYSGLIGLIVAPLMLVQVGVEITYVLQDDYRLLRFLMILVIWLSTLSLSVPCHSRLHKDGKNQLVIKRLVASNWIRTILWSLIFLETVFRSG